jgi:hypothetical protein
VAALFCDKDEVSMLTQTLGKLVFKLNGWQYEVNPDAISDSKQVMVGFPHTTNLDGVRAVALFNILNLNFHLFVKKSYFVSHWVPY